MNKVIIKSGYVEVNGLAVGLYFENYDGSVSMLHFSDVHKNLYYLMMWLSEYVDNDYFKHHVDFMCVELMKCYNNGDNDLTVIVDSEKAYAVNMNPINALKLVYGDSVAYDEFDQFWV